MRLSKLFCIGILLFLLLQTCSPSKNSNKDPVMLDSDGDGVTDNLDECPEIAGTVKYKGCPIPDMDNDNVNDEVDKCPEVPGLAKYDGCPVPDSDSDGVNDEEDKCPTVAGLARYNGCPITDSDDDGINDEEDKCPTIAGTASNNGCPEIAETVSDDDIKDTNGDGVVDNLPINHSNNSVPENLNTENKTVTPSVNTLAKSASIAISYPFTMKKDETRDIKVLLSILHPMSTLKDSLKDIIIGELAFPQLKIKDTIITRSIPVYKTVEVRLVYDSSDIEIMDQPRNLKKVVDTINGNRWDWQIKAISAKAEVHITVKIIAERLPGDEADFSVKNIPIKIKIDPVPVLRRILIWLYENPQYTIPSIIVPLVIFFFRKKKKEEKA